MSLTHSTALKRAKISNFISLLNTNNIFRFDVAMNDTVIVNSKEPLCGI